MKEITILSGKGGAGKTSIAGALASVAKNAVFCDNDVDAADLHLLLNPKPVESHDFDSGSTAFIHSVYCTQCGLCEVSCRFSAIHTNAHGYPQVNPFQCEGCELCKRICPVSAISIHENRNNNWYVSSTRFGPLVHAKMGPGEENSGKLVNKIRERAKEIALQTNAKYILNDGPPGIGCTAISSITGTHAVLLIIEPSVSGLHDANRLIQLVQSFNIPVSAAINKYDINPEFTKTVECYLQEQQIPVLGKIPFTKLMVESMLVGKTIVEFAPGHLASENIKSIWEQLN